jgi:phosphoglycerol transferase MdoB-like AlkP superfamily enzyme
MSIAKWTTAVSSLIWRCAIVGVCFAVVLLVVYRVESPWGVVSLEPFLRGVLIYVAVVAVLFLLTSRLVAATTFALCFTVWLMILSMQKYAKTMQTLHFFDLFVFFQSSAEPIFFAKHYPGLAAGYLASCLALIAIFVVSFRIDKRPKRLAMARALAMTFGLSSIGGVAFIEERRSAEMAWRSSYNYYHYSAFFTTMRDGLQLFGQSDKIRRLIEERSDANRQPPTLGPRPNIIVILHESAVDPMLFKSGPLYEVPRSLFESQDGATRQLLVETYGGLTWLTDYGFNLGLSTHFLGSARSYIGVLASPGQRNNSIARALAAQGYGAVSVYPSPRTFAKSGSAYQAMGYERVIDQHDLGATWRERDRVYYGGALKDLYDRRAAGDTRPMFYFVATMATHAPYTSGEFTENRADEIVRNNTWAEFARRLRLASDDLTDFKTELTKAYPNESFVIVGFSDHQPILTSGLKGIVGSSARPTTLETANINAFETFYRIEGIRFAPNLATARSPLEVGLLSSVVLQAAGIPLDTAMQLRANLAETCNGLMLRCAVPGARDAFVRALENRPK